MARLQNPMGPHAIRGPAPATPTRFERRADPEHGRDTPRVQGAPRASRGNTPWPGNAYSCMTPRQRIAPRPQFFEGEIRATSRRAAGTAAQRSRAGGAGGYPIVNQLRNDSVTTP